MENGRVTSTLRDDAPPYRDWYWLRDRLRQHLLTYSEKRHASPVGVREKSKKKFDSGITFRYSRT